MHGSFWNPCMVSPWLRFCSSRHTCCSEDIWYLSAPTQDGSLALKNKAPVANSKLPWEGHQWFSGVHGQPGSSRGPVKCGQRRGESHKGCGLTMGWAGIRKTLVCSGWTTNKVRGSRWPRGCREDRGRPDTHPGSGRSRGHSPGDPAWAQSPSVPSASPAPTVLSWTSPFFTVAMCFASPHPRATTGQLGRTKVPMPSWLPFLTTHPVPLGLSCPPLWPHGPTADCA